MRHRRAHKNLHLTKGVHRAYLRGIAQAVLTRGQVQTTLEKAKDLRRQIDHLITLGKAGSLQARRRAQRILGEEKALRILFNEVAPLFKNRRGGYTRVVRSWTRVGDGARLALIELTEKPTHPKETKPKEKKTPQASALPETTEKAKEKKPAGFLASLRKFLKPRDRSSP